jgi:hypothetical protein
MSSIINLSGKKNAWGLNKNVMLTKRKKNEHEKK